MAVVLAGLIPTEKNGEHVPGINFTWYTTSDSPLCSVEWVGGVGGVYSFIIMHGCSRVTKDPRIPTMPGRSTSGFYRPGRHFLHQARSET